MASTSKKIKRDDRTNESRKGYAVNVSPIKLESKYGTPYFNVKLQTGEHSTRDIVIYSSSTEKRNEFDARSKTKEGIELLGVTDIPSRNHPSQWDLSGNQHTEIVPRKLDFKATSVDIAKKIKNSDVKGIEEIQTQAIVNVTVKVIECVEDVQEVLVWNRKTAVKTVKVADPSGAINIKLWIDNIDRILLGTTYKFTSLGVREYMGRKYLTTTPSSSWLVVDDIPNINEEDVGIKQKVIVIGEVNLVTVALTKACLSCRKTVTTTDTGSQFIKCPKCKMNMKKDKMIDNILCKLSVEGNSSKYLVPSPVLTEFLCSTEKQDIQGNSDEIENHLLT